MYSKQAPRRPIDRPPTYRQPVRVPPNYSGHAITEPSPEREATSLERGTVIPDNEHFGQGSPPTPRFDGLPRISEAGASPSSPHRAYLPSESAASAGSAFPLREEEDTPAAVPRAPGLFDAHHFPFGHGFGFEELLLLGLILFLLWEAPREEGDRIDRGDLDETLILLGILLLCG